MAPRSTSRGSVAGTPGRLRARAARWGLAGAWAAVIFAFSAIPGSNVPGRYGAVAHFVEYVIFSALLYGALRLDVGRSHAAVLAVVMASGYAVTDEFHQAFVPMRVPDPLDWLVDTAGAIAGVGAAWLTERVVSRNRPSG